MLASCYGVISWEVRQRIPAVPCRDGCVCVGGGGMDSVRLCVGQNMNNYYEACSLSKHKIGKSCFEKPHKACTHLWCT
jgi:hypothetical protein